MQHFYLKDIVDEISVRENNPSSSGYDRFVGLEHYVSGEVEIHDFGSTSNLASAMKVFKSGDILIARRNVYLRRAGVVKFDGLTSGDSIVLRAKNERIAKLLPFIFNTSEFWDYADQNADGTMSKRLSPKILLEYEINLPEPEEQEKLTDLLWGAEETRQAYKKLIKQTDDLMKAKFTEMFGNPITNSKNWPVLPLSVVAPETVGKNIDCQKVWLLNLDMIEDSTGKIIEKVYINKADIGSSTAPFDDTVVLYSKLRPYLNKVVVPNECGYATTELIPLKPDNTKLNKWFLAVLLRSSEFVDFAVSLSGGARMPRMPMTSLRNFDCILPPLSLQENFVEFVQQAEQTKLATQQSLDALNETVRALVNRNFN